MVSSDDRKLFGDGKKNSRATHFHTDESYLEKPCKATVLYSVINPKSGGTTKFAPMYRAYDALLEATKEKFKGLKAVHRFGTSRPGVVLLDLSDEEKVETPDVAHPIVRTHPITGRKALYVNAARTGSVVGMGENEGNSLFRGTLHPFNKPRISVLSRLGRWRCYDLGQSLHNACSDQHLWA